MKFSLICLPFVTALIGWVTNVIAVKMLFHPRRPVGLFGFKVQGLIPRRQAALAVSLADLFAQELVSDQDLIQRLGNVGDAAEPLLDERLDNFVISIKEKIPMASLFLSESLVTTVRGELKREILSGLPDLQHHLISNSLDLRGMVEEKIAAFSIPHLESMVMRVATRELRAIELWGALLGFIIGLIQLFLMSWF